MAKNGYIPGNAFRCDTVEHTLLALQHELIKEDTRLTRRELKRGGNSNIYRMGHYLEAMTECTSESTLVGLRSSIASHFCEGFGPRARVLRAIDECLGERL